MVDKEASLQNIYYFSALAKHLLSSDPDVVKRHEEYIKCLKATGVIVELADFKPKEIYCNNCKNIILRHEEKETDVAIASKIFELFHNNDCDIIVVVSGDTDIKPAIESAKRLYADKQILFAFPHRRKNGILVNIAPESFRLKKERYLKHQFSDPFDIGNGDLIPKPPSW